MTYTGPVEPDHVDEITGQWGRERPDIDTSAMAVIGRLSRLGQRIAERHDAVFQRHGLEAWEFDVLATLRRSGKPYELTPGRLMEAMMITSGAMTNRIDRLEGRGLVTRSKSPDDGRKVLVALTEDGVATLDAALPDHVANQLSMLSGLDGDELERLVDLLRKLGRSLDDQPV